MVRSSRSSSPSSVTTATELLRPNGGSASTIEKCRPVVRSTAPGDSVLNLTSILTDACRYAEFGRVRAPDPGSWPDDDELVSRRPVRRAVDCDGRDADRVAPRRLLGRELRRGWVRAWYRRTGSTCRSCSQPCASTGAAPCCLLYTSP